MGVNIFEGNKAERIATSLETLARGVTGGIPDGGTAGQVLRKASGTDYDVEWGHDSNAAIAPDYSELTFPVAVGTECMHDGVLYSANQAIESSEEWTAAHWTETTVEGQIGQLKSAIRAVAVTPEMFGAKGDGTTDDSQAVQEAVDAGYNIRFDDNKTYYLADTVTIDHDVHIVGGKNTVIKTKTVDGSLNTVFKVSGTLKKETTFTTDYTTNGETDNSGNMITLDDMDGVEAGDLLIVTAADQYYSYARQYYYLGGTLLVTDKDDDHLYTAISLPFDIELTNDVSVEVYSAPRAIIENISFVADRDSIGGYKSFIELNVCKNSIIRDCSMEEMDNGISLYNCYNTLIENIELKDGKNDNTLVGDGYGIVINSCTETFVERIMAMCAQSCVCLGGHITNINTYIRNCDLASQCRHNGIGMHENSYNIVVEDCTLAGLNILGTGIVNRCRFINNRRLGSRSGGITFNGSHNPRFSTLKVSNCIFDGENTLIYVYSPSTQNPVQAFDAVVGLIEVTDCEGGYFDFDGTISQYILSNTIKELRLSRWKNCKEVYLPNAADIIEKMIVSDCSFKTNLWINNHNNALATGNVRELDYSSSIPMVHKVTVNKDTRGERYTLPENVAIALTANSQTAKYIICGNNLAPNDPQDWELGIVSGSDGGTLTRTPSTSSGKPTISNDADGNIVYTQKSNTNNFDMFPIGMFITKERCNVTMSAKLKSESAVKFRPYMAIVDCKTGKLISRYVGAAVEATQQGASISYSRDVDADCAVLCYYYSNLSIANAVTTFEDMAVMVSNAFAPSTADSIQPYEAKRRTGDGTVLSLSGVNNIMCSEDVFHVQFGVDYVENPIGNLQSGTGVSF